MKKPILDFHNQLQTALLNIPDIVTNLSKKSPNVLLELQDWMITVEQALKDNNKASASEVAGLRSRLVAEKFSDQRNGLKKRRYQIASQLIHELQKAVTQEFTVLDETIAESEELLCQMLQLLEKTKALTYDGTEEFTTFINKVWYFCQSHEQLSVGSLQLKCKLAEPDILRLIADNISPHEWV